MCKRTKFASLLVLVSIVANIGVSVAHQATNSGSIPDQITSAARELLFSPVAYAEPTPYEIPAGGLATAQHIAVIAPYAVPLEVEKSTRKQTAVVTAYSSSPDETDSTPFITASGQRVRSGIVANNCLPFGTKVRINGEVYEVQDRGALRHGCAWYDKWTPTKWEARQFGKRTVTVEIL
jgi:3D (Asp-Asp-Asp) domain-containing protein